MVFEFDSPPVLAVSGSAIPPFNLAVHSGRLTDPDDRTGSRSIWVRPGTLGLPIYEAYELLADVNGSTVVFSDDPAVSAIAADDPAGAVYLRFQGAQVDALTGQVVGAIHVLPHKEDPVRIVRLPAQAGPKLTGSGFRQPLRVPAGTDSSD